MTLGDVLKDAMQVFGFPDATSAPQAAKDRALIDINAALQQLEEAGEDFYAREELAVTLTADTETYTLDKNVQTVLNPAVLNDGTLLRQLGSRGALLQYGQVFLGQLNDTLASGKPSAYYVESLRDASDTTGDSVAIILHLVPKPSSSVVSAITPLKLSVIKQPAAVTAAALTTGTAILEVPNNYVESVFLPIMRRNLSLSFLFYDKDKQPGIEADYERALRILGKVDPRRPKPAESNTTALEGAPARR